MADRQWKPKIQCPVELKDYFESIKIFLECKKKKKTNQKAHVMPFTVTEKTDN